MSSQKKDEKDRLDLALKASNEGVWDWDIAAGKIFYSNRVLGFLGYGQIDAPNIFADLGVHVHPSDLRLFQRKMERLLGGTGRFLAIEPRIKTQSGAWKWFRVRGIPVRNEEGKVIRLVGSMIDISKRKNAEAALAEEQKRIQLLFENIPVNVYFKDLESRFVRVNRATAKRLGADSIESMIGKTDSDYFEKEHAIKAQQDEAEIVRTGESRTEELENEVWDDGRESWVLVSKYPWRGSDGKMKGTFGVTNDVTELIKAQEELAAVTEQLSDVNLEIESERHLLRLVIDNIPLYVYFKDRESNFVLVNQWMADLFGEKNPKDTVGKNDHHYFGEKHGEIARADELAIMKAGEPIIGRLEKVAWEDGRVSWSLTSKFPWFDQQGKNVGIFGVSGDVTELVETRNELAKIADALSRKNKSMEEELQLAREVQQAAIPESLPTFRSDHWSAEFYHRYEPASDLAGDFFEVIPLGNDRAGFLVCDVMGHGVRAALIVSMLRGLIEKELDHAREPGRFLTGLNDGLSHLLERVSFTMFATAVYGVVDLHEDELRISLAGHPSPLIKKEGEITEFEVKPGKKGPALGLMEGCPYWEQTLKLSEVEGLLCFTDGLVEAENAEGEQFGVTRMAEILNKATDLRLGMDRALQAAREFSGEAKFEDDICLLGLDLHSLSLGA